MPFHSPAKFASTVVLGSLVIAALLGTPRFAEAQRSMLREIHDTDGDIRIEIESVFSGSVSRGYLPVRVKLRNLRKQDRNWKLQFNFGGGWNEMAFSSTFRVSAEGGTEPVHELMVPVPAGVNTGSSMYHTVNIEATTSGFPAAGNTDSSYYSTDWPMIGLSKKLAERNANRLEDAVQKRTGSSHNDAFGARFDPETLPADWRGYTGLDVLMMTDTEWQSVPAGARIAVVEWIRLGGRLDLYTTGDPAPAVNGLVSPPGDNPTARERSVSLGEVHGWKWNGQDLEPNEMVNRYRKVVNRGVHLAESYRNSTSWPLYSDFGGKSFSAWLVILLLIAFGVIVGPINLFVWAKPGQRHRLFVTTPLISLAASGLIMLLILVKDGIGGRGARVVLANLQSEAQEKRLYVTQEQISRTGVLLGSGFTIDEPVFLAQVIVPPSEWNRIDNSGNTVARFSLNGRTFRGDWFQSRSEQGQFGQVVRPTRSRIELTAPSPDGEAPPKLFSSLEFSIGQLFYRDDEGRVWKSAEGRISGGEEIVLASSTPEDLEEWWLKQVNPLSSGVRARAEKLWERDGQFFAVSTDRSAGFVETLGAVDWKEDTAVVFGSVSTTAGGGSN